MHLRVRSPATPRWPCSTRSSARCRPRRLWSSSPRRRRLSTASQSTATKTTTAEPTSSRAAPAHSNTIQRWNRLHCAYSSSCWKIHTRRVSVSTPHCTLSKIVASGASQAQSTRRHNHSPNHHRSNRSSRTARALSRRLLRLRLRFLLRPPPPSLLGRPRPRPRRRRLLRPLRLALRPSTATVLVLTSRADRLWCAALPRAT
mmetsp:Transcript_15671/g.46967  ORF Transcript_15671/g.46967 Transcript_15671/m.46967 type:complete len:202 (+) Transcript_15671:697-1302(+)